MKPIKVVNNGSVPGVPKELVCGECGAGSGELIWHAFTDDAGALVGAVGVGNCSRCRRRLAGVLAHDKRVLHELQEFAEGVIDSDA